MIVVVVCDTAIEEVLANAVCHRSYERCNTILNGFPIVCIIAKNGLARQLVFVQLV